MSNKTKKRKPRELTRKQRSRLEKERRLERFLIWGVIVVAVAVAGVLTYGFVVEKILKEREPVAVVGDVPITTAEFQARVRFLRAQLQSELQYLLYQQQTIDPTASESEFYLQYLQDRIRELQSQLSPMNALAIGEQALDRLIQEELVRQEAERVDIDVTAEEVQREIELSFGYDPNPATPEPTLETTGVLTSTDGTPEPVSTPPPTPTPMTEQDFRQRYNNYLRETLKPLGISEQQYRSWLEASLLIERMRERMIAEVPDSADQVKVQVLVLNTEDLANDMVARLDAGEDFETLINELEESEDEEVGGYGTELAWLPQDVLESRLGEELAELAFDLEVGEHSQPVLDPDSTSYIIIEVVGHEMREVDQSLREQMGEGAFQEWLEAQQVLVERRTYSDRIPTDP